MKRVNRIRLYGLIVVICMVFWSVIFNTCRAQMRGPVESGAVFFPGEDPADLSNSFKLISGWAEFSQDEVCITFKKRKREDLNEFIFPVDSTTINYIQEMTEQIFWIHPGIRDSGYTYPRVLMLYYTEREWWVFIIMEDMMFHFKGDVS